MTGLAEDQNIIINPTDKGSCVVVWDQGNYLAEADRQLKVARVLHLKLVFTDYFLYNLIVLIK